MTISTKTSSGRSRSVIAIYASGLLIGIALILFPSAGPLFTDPAYHNLSSAQFGVLFTPQIITAIAASALTASAANRFGMKRVLVGGLCLALLAMALLIISQFAIGMGGDSAFIVLLLATGAVGAGFGFTISALNAFAFDLFPNKRDSAVTAIHIMTGIGQVGAALLLNLFVGIDLWWGAPLAIAIAIVVMLAFQTAVPLRLSTERAAGQAREIAAASSVGGRGGLPLRVWLYALVVFTYGAIEGTFGNWTPIYLEEGAGLAMADAALGLSLFWGAVTVGRVIFALLAARFRVKPLYLAAPFVVGAVFVLLPTLSGTVTNFIALIVAGLAISFFFPYSVSLASAEYPARAAAVSGALVAGLQLGNGISANLVGVASQTIPLATIFQLSVVYALVMAGVVIYLGVSQHRGHNNLPKVESNEQ